MSGCLTVSGGGRASVGLGGVVTPVRGGGAAQRVQDLAPVTQSTNEYCQSQIQTFQGNSLLIVNPGKRIKRLF